MASNFIFYFIYIFFSSEYKIAEKKTWFTKNLNYTSIHPSIHPSIHSFFSTPALNLISYLSHSLFFTIFIFILPFSIFFTSILQLSLIRFLLYIYLIHLHILTLLSLISLHLPYSIRFLFLFLLYRIFLFQSF